jgi:oxygen-independent coproporphyrinogen-3 oxidase
MGSTLADPFALQSVRKIGQILPEVVIFTLLQDSTSSRIGVRKCSKSLDPSEAANIMTTSQDSSWRRNRGVYDLPAAGLRPRAIYIHVPFCLHRCGYCDFTLVADRDDLVSRYLQAMSNELSQLTETCSVDSVFVGGGTPTHLTSDQLAQLLEIIAGKFELSSDGEYSFEANPDGLDDDRLTVLRDGGVNRISLGVQSFDAAVLKTLERTHNPQESRDVVQRTQSYIPNVSLDLIFGVPGQSQTSWTETLKTAIELPVRHVSTYGLTFEKGTAFYQRRSQGQFQLASNETERQQYASAMSILGEAGFEQYEISNYAQANARCRHNEVYWDASEYFAFGPGAARYVNGIRSTNGRNVTRWIESWLQGEPLLQDCEQLSATDRAREAVMLGLRRNQGILQHTFQQRFGCSVRSLAPDAFAQHLEQGLLAEVIEEGHESEPERWLRLTSEGRFLADNVVIDFL